MLLFNILNMEIVSSTSTRSLIRKNTLKRSSGNINFKQTDGKQRFRNIFKYKYDLNEMKMLILLSLIYKFSYHKQKIVQDYQRQNQQKLKKTGVHFNRISSTISIEPIKKQIIYLNDTSLQLQKIRKHIETYFCNLFKKQLINQSINLLAINVLHSCFDTPNQISWNKNVQKQNSSQVKTPSKVQFFIDMTQKQNVQFLKYESKKNQSCLYKTKFHKRFFSDFSSLSGKSSPERSIIAKKQKSIQEIGKRRQKCFMSRKKQQIDFIRKITVEFNSQQAEYKALLQTIELFFKNMTRSNYYVKIIDHNAQKCQQISVYVNQLNKLLKQIIEILLRLSLEHKSLIIKQAQPKMGPMHSLTTSLVNKQKQGEKQILNSESIGTKTQLFKNIPIQIEEYYGLSHRVKAIIRQFLISPAFATIMKPLRSDSAKLISLLVEARYVLRYLEKEIQNFQFATKQNTGNIPKWQKAYRVKFLPKKNLC